MKKTGITILLGAVIFSATAQERIAAQERLTGYIRQGLDNNQVLKQKTIAIDQALLAEKIAKSLSLPSASLIADYTSAQGGRLITVPAGDLMNPVHSYLNQLGTSHKFPQIRNLNEPLLPTNFYDLRVHIIYPVLNSDIHYNQQISN